MTAKPSTIAIIAPGEMGAAIARRLTDNGVRVLTRLTGRSAATRARAEAAGMADADDDGLVAADMILSVLPPSEAMAFAEGLAPALAAAANKPLFADCNAASPETKRAMADVVAKTGAPFVDAGIVGLPPRPDGYTPTLYACGPGAARFADLDGCGLKIVVLDGPVGQASALKMCYSGLNKGLYAIAASVMLAAAEAGVGEAFLKELEHSQPQIIDYLSRRLPAIFSKTWRWGAEMEEIGDFLGGGGEQLFDGAARQFERLAADRAGDRLDEAAILSFLSGKPPA